MDLLAEKPMSLSSILVSLDLCMIGASLQDKTKHEKPQDSQATQQTKNICW